MANDGGCLSGYFPTGTGDGYTQIGYRRDACQLRRLPRQVVYGQTSLELSLTAMGEIEERLEDAVANRRRLLAIKDTAIQELEALQLLKRVDEARSKLASLKKNGLLGASSGEETQEQIRQLEGFIAANSRQAEQAITDRFRQRMDGDLTAI